MASCTAPAPECRLGTGHTRSSPNSLWSLSRAATELKLAFRSIFRDPAVLFNLQGQELVAQRENHWSRHCSVVSHGAPPLRLSSNTTRCPSPWSSSKSLPLTSGSSRHQLLSHGIYIERREATRCSLLPPSIGPAPLPSPRQIPGLAHTQPRFPPRSRPAVRISGFRGPDRLVD